MIKQTALIVFCLALCASATAATRRFEIAPAEGQSSRFVDGTQWVAANGQTAQLVASARVEDAKAIWFFVSIENRSNTEVTIRDTDVVASLAQKPVKVNTHKDMLAIQKRKEGWQKFGLVMFGPSASPSAGTTTTTGSYTESTNIQGTGGYANASTSGTYSSTTRDSRAAAQESARAQAEYDALARRIRENGERVRASLDARMFRTNTVSPGQAVAGDLMIEIPSKTQMSAGPLVVTVPFAGEQFVFSIVETK